MNEIELHAQKLRDLAKSKPSQKGLAFVRESLLDKREGIQGGALNVLKSWGGRDAIALARASLERNWDRKFGWSIRGVAIKVLEAHITSGDFEWVETLYREAIENHDDIVLKVHLRQLYWRAEEVRDGHSERAPNPLTHSRPG